MDDCCQFCLRKVEDLAHALCYYSTLAETYKTFLPHLTFKNSIAEFIEVAMRVRDVGNREGSEKFFLIAWGLRYKRNQKINERTSLEVEQVVNHTLSYSGN